MIADLLVVAILVYAAYMGTRRGLILVACELIGLILATAIALGLYSSLGNVVKSLAHISISLGDVTAFIVVWIIIEIGFALVVRFILLPRIRHRYHVGTASQIGGALLHIIKSLAEIAIVLIVFAGLPVTASAKDYVTNAAIPRLILARSGQLQDWLSRGLGGDLANSLNFYTVDSDPQSTERIELGYTTTGTVDPASEAAMLTDLNHERTSRGIPPLVLNTKARTLARAHSEDMFEHGYFSHINNQHQNPFDRMRAAGILFGAAGENLALAPTLPLAEQGLMNSPPHRANILDRAYKSVGIGIIDGGPYGLMITQDFTDR